MLERTWLKEATRGTVNADWFADLSEERSIKLASPYVADPMLIRTGLNRPQEAIEELADCKNHVVFWMQEEDLTHEEEREMLEALDLVARASTILRRHA